MQIYKKKHHDFSKPPELRCSFCGKKQDEVMCLIAGPTVYICNECVDICNEIIAEKRADPPLITAAKGDIAGHIPIEAGSICSFCLKVLPDSKMLMVPERGQLCPACVKATRSALAGIRTDQ